MSDLDLPEQDPDYNIYNSGTDIRFFTETVLPVFTVCKMSRLKSSLSKCSRMVRIGGAPMLIMGLDSHLVSRVCV